MKSHRGTFSALKSKLQILSHMTKDCSVCILFEENVFIFQFLNDKIHNYGFLEQISLKNYYQKGKKRSNLVSLLKLIGLQIPHTSWGHISPQKPWQLWPQFSFKSHFSSHIFLLHLVLHFFVHFECLQDNPHFSLQSEQSSWQVLLH